MFTSVVFLYMYVYTELQYKIYFLLWVIINKK